MAHVRNKQEPGPDCPAERSLGAAAESGKKLERPAGLPGLSSAAERPKPGTVVTEDEDEDEDEDEGNQVRPGPQDEANSSMPSENPEREPLPIAAHSRENSG